MTKEVLKKATEFEASEIVIELKFPVVFGSETITHVVLKPLTGRHIRGLSSEPDFDEILKVAAKASGLSDKAFDLMRASDLRRIVEAVGEAL